MSRRSIISCLAATVVGLMTAGVEEAVAQDRLYTLTQERRYSVGVGDYIQVRYVTQAIPNGIADLKVNISGESIRTFPVFTGSMPGEPSKPGVKYYIIALFRAEELPPGKNRESRIVVTPITNDGQELKKFAFSLSVR